MIGGGVACNRTLADRMRTALGGAARRLVLIGNYTYSESGIEVGANDTTP